MYKHIIILLLLLTSLLFSQSKEDSLRSINYNFEIQKLNSIHTDWNVINSPLLFYPMNTLPSSYSNNPSLYALYTNSQINSGLSIIKPDAMLNQFQLVNNWETKKKYGVFAKYLGIAQFMGAIGIAAVSIANQDIVPKGKAKLKQPKIKNWMAASKTVLDLMNSCVYFHAMWRQK